MTITVIFNNHARYKHVSKLSSELDACAEVMRNAIASGCKGGFLRFEVER